MPDLILSIHLTGTPDHPRYMISSQDLEFWTGDDWTCNESDARLYVSVNDAGCAIHEILLAQHGDKPHRQFVAPVYIDLYAETDLSEKEIREWLTRAARLTIDPEVHGNGPVAGSLGLCRIEWRHLREIENED